MPKHKTLCIDLRWIDKSGVGMYIKGILPEMIENLGDVAIVGIGDVERLKMFSWAANPHVRLIDCSAKPYSMAEQFALPRLIPRETDVFFSPYYTFPLLYRGKMAITVHDLSHLQVDEIVSHRRKRIYAKVMYRELRKRAALILTVSQFSKAELLRLTGGSNLDNIFPIYLGVCSEWYGASIIPAVREKPYFVCVGNIKPYKNVGRLVDAFLSVKERIPHSLILVGQSEGLITGESSEFFAKLRDAGERIQLTGFVSQQALLSLVGHADALIMPSLYEGFGLPPLEAMAAGVPAAVARTASLPEICGDAALYFDPLRVDEIAEKMVEIATDNSLRKQLIEKGLQRSRRFRWDECAQKTSAELRRVLYSPN
jgi:glycosyltransferase involved in cell wall biosynthesis